MILHSKPVGYSEPRIWSDWHFRGSIGAGKPRPDKEVEEEKKEEFFTEEEFKL